MATPEQPNQDGASTQWIEGGESGVTTETLPRHMKFVRVATSELEDLKSSNSTLELAFFGISFGCLVSVAVTLGTVAISDATTKAVFVGSVILFGLGTLYFGLATVRGELRWRRKIDALKSGGSMKP